MAVVSSGIAYRIDGEIVITTAKEILLWMLTDIPLPARRLLPISRYRALDYPVSMITGRGCPYGCIFCLGRKMVGSKVRRRNPKLVLDEMEQILGLGFERINIADDLFASDTEPGQRDLQRHQRTKFKIHLERFCPCGYRESGNV
ncbi:MAG: hypothetical protein M0C28_08465 [Candidatus Moduliflexus flocculans]|nr:hypothetical protein [Candidatus Moduliflexus flocculans]